MLLNASRDYENALKVGGAALARLQDRCLGGPAAPSSEQSLIAVEELRRDLRLAMAITHCDIARDALGETDDDVSDSDVTEVKESGAGSPEKKCTGETLLKSAAALDMAASCLESAAYDSKVIISNSKLSESAKKVLTAPLAPELLEEIETSLEMLAPFVALQQLALPLEDSRRMSALKEMPGIITLGYSLKNLQQSGRASNGGHTAVVDNDQYSIPPLILREKHEFAEKALLSMTAAEVARIVPWEKIGRDDYDGIDNNLLTSTSGVAEYGPPSPTFLTIGGLAHLFLAAETREPAHLILADRLFELAEMKGAPVQTERLVVTFLAGQVEAATHLLDTIDFAAESESASEAPLSAEGDDENNRDSSKTSKKSSISTVFSPSFRSSWRDDDSDERIQQALGHLCDQDYRRALSKTLIDTIRTSSGGNDETLPGLCISTTRFINRTAPLIFRSAGSYRRDFSLTDWFDDSRVQNFAVNAVQSFSQTLSPSDSANTDWLARIRGAVQSLAMAVVQLTARLFLPFLRVAQWMVTSISGNSHRRRPRYLRGSADSERKRNAKFDIFAAVLGVVMMVACAVGGIFVLGKSVQALGPRLTASVTNIADFQPQLSTFKSAQAPASSLSRATAERVVRVGLMLLFTHLI